MNMWNIKIDWFIDRNVYGASALSRNIDTDITHYTDISVIGMGTSANIVDIYTILGPNLHLTTI